MAISTFAQLQTAIAEWANKTNVTAKTADFITLAEANINRKLRTRWQETALAATAIDASYHIAIPAGAVAIKALWRQADPTWRIEQKDLTYVVEQRAQAGLAQFVAWEGTSWSFDSASDTITGVYYIKVPALSVSNTTNWLLTDHPDLYLWACLEQCAIYLRDFEGAVGMAATAQDVIDTLNSISKADQISGGPLIARGRNQLSYRSVVR